MLDVLSWFTKWKTMHDTVMVEDNSTTTEYNFFADETQFCICALTLLHVEEIQVYCINKGEKVNSRNLITGVVELFFGDIRQSGSGSANKMTARYWNQAGFKAAAFKAGKHRLIGNNKTGKDHFNRQQ